MFVLAMLPDLPNYFFSQVDVSDSPIHGGAIVSVNRNTRSPLSEVCVGRTSHASRVAQHSDTITTFGSVQCKNGGPTFHLVYDVKIHVVMANAIPARVDGHRGVSRCRQVRKFSH